MPGSFGDHQAGFLGKHLDHIIGLWNDGLVCQAKNRDDSRGSRELALSLVEGAARARPVLGGGVALDKRGRMGYIVSRT